MGPARATDSLRLGWRFLAALLTLAAVAASTSGPALAQAPKKYGNALDLAPADAAFFHSMLRNGEQVEIAAKSKAWAKFQQIPTVQQGLGAWQMVWAFQIQPAMAGENKQLWDLSGDLLSHEIFYYGDTQSIEALTLLGTAMNSAQFGGAIAQMQSGGNANPQETSKAQVHAILQELNNKADKLDTPTVVVGMKTSHPDEVKHQLDRLQKAVEENIDEAPQLKGRFAKEKVGDYEYLTLKLDGGMVPWDEIPRKEIEKTPGEFDKLFNRLKEMKLVIALGVRDDYLLLAFTKSVDKLATIGAGAKLADKPEFAKLEKFRDKRLVSLNYTAAAYRQLQMRSGIDTIKDMAAAALSSADLPADMKQRITADVAELSADATMPKFGDQLGECHLTDQGYESYSWDWSGAPSLDGSKPLTITKHLGGAPLVALANRARGDKDSYPKMIKWVKRAYSYVEDFAIPKLAPAEQKEYKRWFSAMQPLLARLDSTTEKMLIPALADQQLAFVIDAKLTSKSWFKGMPKSDSPLPLVEPAIVLGVSDPDLLKKAMIEYRSIVDDAIAKIRELKPDAIPPGFKLPEPQVRETADGSIYNFPLPKDAGVDYQIAPSAGLGKNTAVLALAPKHVAELLATKPLEVEGPAGESASSHAAIGYLDWAGVIEAATPWVEYAIRQNVKVEDEDAPGGGTGGTTKAQLKETLSQVRSLMDVLKVLRTVSSASYLEGDVLVNHTETHFRDLE